MTKHRRALEPEMTGQLGKTLLYGLAVWVVILGLAFFGLRSAWRALRSADEVLPPGSSDEATRYEEAISQSQQQEQGQEQATAERVAQMFTGQEVDYAALMEGDTLYAGTIASLVSLNFPDFTDIKAVENDYIIAYGVWESLKNPAFAGGAVASEDRVYVTAESVEKVASEELGYDSVLNHHSIERFGDFKFDVITSRYSAPSYGIDVAGYAKVKSCETEGDIVELTVDCYEDDVETEQSTLTAVRRIVMDLSGDLPLVKSVETLE